MFDLSKCPIDSNGHKLCQTVSGDPVRIVAQRDHGYPLVTLRLDGGSERTATYTIAGSYHGSSQTSENDLVNLPVPKTKRNMRPDEIPLLALFREKKYPKGRHIIVSVHSDGTVLIGKEYNTIESLVRDGDEFSTDGGKTWKPFTIEE